MMLGAHPLSLAGAALLALPSGALLWPERRLLVVSDLHLGKSERMARRGGAFLPPFDTLDTLSRLQAVLDATDPQAVLCLGDSFDDDAAARALGEPEATALRLALRGRRWIWAEGNHDPGPLPWGGERVAEIAIGPLAFRHIAEPGAPIQVAGQIPGQTPVQTPIQIPGQTPVQMSREVSGEVSGHYHPKATVGGASRPCFLVDRQRIVMPAFGTYTGGLSAGAAPLQALMAPGALAILTGRRALAIPMPRLRRAS